MNNDNIFSVTNDDLGRLDQTTATIIFQELLWAEARRIGVEISKINVSRRVNVPDGGIDATIHEVQVATGLGIIMPGKTSCQIKSGKTFKPWEEAIIKEELFGTKTPSQQHLGESIRACLDDNGTYVLVCTGIDLVDTEHRSACNHIKEYLQQSGYTQPKVEVWSQNNLIGFLESFPSLALGVNGRDGAPFQTHRSWARDADMRVKFVPGQEQEELIANIQTELRRDNDTIHVRVWGEPGIGKTKLVFEATKTEDLSPLVIYCTATQFRDSNLMNEILRDDNHFSAILVIDECDPDNRSYIWNKLKYRGSRIKLITIYNDYEEIPGDIAPYDMRPLGKEQIQNVLQEYGVPADQTSRWAELCSGSPRVAHVIGENLRNNPDDVLKPLSTVNIWDRYVVGNSDQNSSEVKERKRALRNIALFKRFGYGWPDVGEAKTIAQKARIEWERFQEIVLELKNRRILQGETTLYITPKAVHIKLWTEWWENYGTGFDLEEFTQGLTPKLVGWFYEMFQYAAESNAASRIVKDLLGPNGPFQDGEYLRTRLGSHFFFALAEAQPKSALNCLKLTVGNWDKETLLQYEEGRSYVVLALEKIAMWHELFADAARLLLALGEAENDFVSNNASGVFVELFSAGRGKVAPTEASPAERFPILQEAFDSGSKERRALALRACNAALQSEYITRFGNAEYQGLRPEPKLWTPKTYSEIWDAYKQVWQLLSEQLTRLPEDERKDGAEVLLAHAREIARIPGLADMVVDTVATIAKQMYVSEKQVIETINAILRYDGEDLPAETRGRWEQLMGELVGSDFHSMMQRYVGMNLPEDLQFDEDRNRVDRAQPQIEALAQQAVDAPSLLRSELDWLVTPEAQNGYRFGHELGKRDDGFCLLPTLLDAQRNAEENASVAFLGGYFCAIFEGNEAEWDEQLDALIDETELNRLIPELTARSGLTDRAGRRVLDLARNGIIGVNHFEVFAYGKEIQNLSDEVFTEWTLFLVNANEKSAMSTALYLYHRYYVFQKPEPSFARDLTLRVITQPSLFDELDRYRFSTMTEYYWTEISRIFLQLYPEKSLELVEPMFSHFGHDGSIAGVSSQTCSVLDQITDTEQYRGDVWGLVSKLLEDRTDFSRVISLERWLCEGSSVGRKRSKAALTRIPKEKIWEWIDNDLENRAWYFAGRLVPKTLSAEEWKTSLAREFLVRYGARKDVRSSLITNYLTESYHGPPSLHYQEKQEKLLQIRAAEDDINVKYWIDDFVEVLKEQEEREKRHEAREPF